MLIYLLASSSSSYIEDLLRFLKSHASRATPSRLLLVEIISHDFTPTIFKCQAEQLRRRSEPASDPETD